MREPRVTYQPIGRLGNQMFQCAAAIGYAKKYNVGWACPNDTKEVPRFHEFFPSLPRYDGHEFKRYNAADPSQFNYWPIPEHKQGVKLVGFFQSEKFFEGAHDEIRKVFKLDIKPVDAVSIHVRRGDYVQHPNSFPPVTSHYVYDAMNIFVEQGIKHFIVFSDDLEWCKENIPIHKNVQANQRFGVSIEFSEGRNEFEDLSLMASCSHHIIANSTFSWWGAWLGHNPDKIVVSPSADNWFGPGFTGGVPKDLIPSTWHQIKFR
jgi:hypothetical protein